MTISKQTFDPANSLSLYKLAAIDLDGTLLDADTQISQANLDAIRKLERHGLKIVLASGRNEHGMIKFQKQLGLSGPMVSYHGALVKNPETEEIIFFKPLTKSATQQVVNEANKHGATVIYYHRQGIFALEENEWTAFFNQRSTIPLKFTDTFESFHSETPYKIIWLHKPAVLSKVFSNLNVSFTEDLYVVQQSPEYLEFLSPEANKAIGLEAVANYLGIKREAIISFGDADNDIPMLSWAALGIAMHHATEGAKKAADIIAPAGRPETCFARAVDALFS